MGDSSRNDHHFHSAGDPVIRLFYTPVNNRRVTLVYAEYQQQTNLPIIPMDTPLAFFYGIHEGGGFYR